MKTVVITYNCPGKDWASMGEIIPSLERLWAASRDFGQNVVFYRVGKDHPNDFLPHFWQAQRIVFLSTFPYKPMAQLMKFLRQHINPKAYFVIYTHDLATVGCWRLEAMGVLKLLRNSDQFVVSCEGDVKALKKTLKGVRMIKHPFILLTEEKRARPLEWRTQRGPTRFVYVGRLSEQKLLHVLLWSFFYFKKSSMNPWKLEIFGDPDGLGSPNMGHRYPHYGAYLRDLVRKLGLEKNVIFHGHVNREDLYTQYLKRPHIFVSPSLHSDENFGAAAFRSLWDGNLAVLSSWGGHLELGKQFKFQVQMAAVYSSTLGTFISPFEFAQLLLRAQYVSQKLTKEIFRRKIVNNPGRKDFDPCTYIQRLLWSKMKSDPKSTSLQMTPLGQSIWHQWKKLRELNTYGPNEDEQDFFANRIFYGHSDKLARPFEHAYGAQRFSSIKFRSKLHFLQLAPWVQIKDQNIFIDDPHRGQFARERKGRIIELRAQMANGHEVDLTKSEAQWLLRHGFAFTYHKANR